MICTCARPFDIIAARLQSIHPSWSPARCRQRSYVIWFLEREPTAEELE